MACAVTLVICSISKSSGQSVFGGISIAPHFVRFASSWQHAELSHSTGMNLILEIERFALEVDLLYTNQEGPGICEYWINPNQCYAPSREEWHFLTTPLLVSYELEKLFKLRPIVGLQAYYLLKGISDFGNYWTYNTTYLYGVIGLGRRNVLSNKIHLLTQVRYEFNFSDHLEGGAKEKNQRISLVIGVLYGKENKRRTR